MSFDDISREPEQAFRLNRDPLAELEYPTKYVSEEIYTQFVKIICRRIFTLVLCDGQFLVFLNKFYFFNRIARFSNVNHLSIHIPRNFGADSTRVYYIGLRGEYTEVFTGL